MQGIGNGFDRREGRNFPLFNFQINVLPLTAGRIQRNFFHDKIFRRNFYFSANTGLVGC